ncbi:right-handed parallel beta-helix repeat-containing protein [Candidatus Bathyarchaeota archaeon]|nr:right-handed parallel beta-helix repeat-containing protein [Candidatus Bathyarchaeota archaeon]
MNKIILVVFFAVLISFTLPTTVFADTHTEVTADVAKQMIDSNPSIVILDVRNQSEYDAEHIRNAKLIPLYELPSRLGELGKNDTILVYCKGGFRSHNASLLLDSNGFLYVYDMQGGINAWKAFGYPVYVKYSSIQQAINSASPGATLFVSSSTYYEHVVVNKSISLIGENKHTTIVDGSNSGTVFDVTSSNVSISDFTMRQSGCGCYGFCGIRIENSQNITLENNNIVSNGYGIMINSAREILIAHNNISGNAYPGITLINSSKVSILDNFVVGNIAGGINLIDANNNTISGNTISNYLYGLNFSKSETNSVFGNTFSNCFNGIYLTQSNGTLFFYNNFIQNTRHVRSLNSTNNWDNGAEGNYWSNYTGVDSNYDGIGETHHIIDLNNTDNYPLMGMFTTFPLKYKQETHHVDTVSNSTISKFQFNENAKTIGFNVTGPDGTWGFCRVTIPSIIIQELWLGNFTVLVNGQPAQFRNWTNDADIYIYFTYQHPENTIIIIPEIPLILPFLIIFMLFGAWLLIRKGRRKNLKPLHKTLIFREFLITWGMMSPSQSDLCR